MNEQTGVSGFYGLGISPNILTVLDRLQFITPTPIQEKAIPSAIEGKDVMGIAQTGTGKTLAFGIPMLQRVLNGDPTDRAVRGLVVLPTRELALQVYESFNKIGMSLGLRMAVLIGGEPIGKQISALRRNPQIVICTPGRVIDHLEQRTIQLNQVNILVLDEADRMLDMGFAPQLEQIMKTVPKDRQTMLFSATMPQSIIRMAHSYMKLPTRVEIVPQGTPAAKVTQELYFVDKHDKPRLLEKILTDFRGSVLVFSRTKFGAKKLAIAIRQLGHSSTEIHSNRSLSQRKDALLGFRNGKYRILVATDIAARGIDVKGIELVLNYDLPDNPEDYIHRIGRTGRAGAPGHAVSFATHDQRYDVKGIERLMRGNLPLTKLPENLPPRKAQPAFIPDEREERGSRRANRGGSRGGYRGGAGTTRSGSSYGQKSFGGKPSGASRFSGSSDRKPFGTSRFGGANNKGFRTGGDRAPRVGSSRPFVKNDNDGISLGESAPSVAPRSGGYVPRGDFATRKFSAPRRGGFTSSAQATGSFAARRFGSASGAGGGERKFVRRKGFASGGNRGGGKFGSGSAPRPRFGGKR